MEWMVRILHERVLLIGDDDRQVQPALLQAVPSAQVTAVPTLFDGIAELAAGTYTTILAAAEPIERRPEAAVKTLREMARDARLLLFGHPTLELLSRKMLQFGVDDYVITPATAGEFEQIFGTPPLRLAAANDAEAPQPTLTLPTESPSAVATLLRLPFADVLLVGVLQHTHDAPGAARRSI